MAIRLAIEGDLRFISHHDTMRLFERALTRAQLPVKYSEGYNPRPRLSLPLPRAVGIASDAELLVVEMHEGVGAAEVVARLSPQMPPGLTLAEGWMSTDKRPPEPQRVEYEMALGAEDVPEVTERLGRLLASDLWPIQRDSAPGRAGRAIDLRCYLLEASVHHARLTWATRVTNRGTVRPAEFLSAVGLSPAACLHRVRRIAVEWRTGDSTLISGRVGQIGGACANGEHLTQPPASSSERHGCHESRLP